MYVIRPKPFIRVRMLRSAETRVDDTYPSYLGLFFFNSLGRPQDDFLVFFESEASTLSVKVVLCGAAFCLAIPRPARLFEHKTKAHSHAVKEACARFSITSLYQRHVGIGRCILLVGLSLLLIAHGGTVIQSSKTRVSTGPIRSL